MIMEEKKTKILLVSFKNEIKQCEIPLFRGAIVKLLEKENVLFHNHTDSGLRYAYPLVQYKRMNNKAALVCVEQGIESVGNIFALSGHITTLGTREVLLDIDYTREIQLVIQLSDANFRYSLQGWLPFNGKNHEAFKHITGLKERLAFMENILTGNILSFAKGINIHFKRQVSVSITNFESIGTMHLKAVNFAAYDIIFETNVSIPDYVGLGKGVSQGFGLVMRVVDNHGMRQQ
jgi:hypothetical protein